MTGFDRPVLLEVDNCGTSFRLTEEATYSGSQGDSWVIPRGFSTDFATVPAAVSWAVPKLGAYTLASIVHDLLCDGLNDWHRGWRWEPLPDGRGSRMVRTAVPTATAVDTDAIFRKIARSYGTDRVTATLLWVGVRWGALFNPARRQGWLSTAPRVIGLSLLFSPVLVPATVLAVVGGAVLGLIRRLVA